MDKSRVAEPDWLEKQIKHLGDCFNISNKKGRVIEIIKRMNGMPIHHAKAIFRNFIDTNDKFPNIKEFNEQVNIFKNRELEELKRFEASKVVEFRPSKSVAENLKERARPMKLLLKKDPKKFKEIKDEYDLYFPNILSQSKNKNSVISDNDLRVNACFNLMNEFYTDPEKVIKAELENCSPGIKQKRLLEGLKRCQSSQLLHVSIAKSC